MADARVFDGAEETLESKAPAVRVCVLPEHRGRRIDESLIALCTHELRSRNFMALSLTVTEANDRAVDLYERLGFDIKRRFDAFVWEG